MTAISYRCARLLIPVAVLTIGLVGSQCQPSLAARPPKPCTSISSGQLQAWFGKPMIPGIIMAGTVGCHWVSADAAPANLNVQVLPAQYYQQAQDEEPHRRGFSRLKGIGDRAFVLEVLEARRGWTAGAVKGTNLLVIHLDGGKTNRATAVAVLTSLLKTL